MAYGLKACSCHPLIFHRVCEFGYRSIFRRAIVPKGFYSEVSLFKKKKKKRKKEEEKKNNIPNGHYSEDFFIPKGHYSKIRNNDPSE